MKDDANEIESDNKDKIIRPWSYQGIIAEEGQGPLLKDIHGKTYIDCTSAFFVMNVGHSHPEVVEEIRKNAEKLTQITTFQSSVQSVKMAKKLTEIVPVRGQDMRVYYTVGGSDTIEGAVRFARSFTKREGLIALQGAYHGWTYGAVALTGLKSYRDGIGPVMPGVYHAAPPYCYRCPYNLTFPECDLFCAKDSERFLKAETENIGAFIVEPIPGAGGCIVPPDGWYQEIREICDKNNLIMIADEVQTGFGRAGKMFASQIWNVEPDIICLSKSLGGGLPLGAVVTRKEIAAQFKIPSPGTFAGHSLACAAGLKTIEIIERDRLWENAARVGEHFQKRFTELQEKHPTIGDVRFKGLMGGVELVKDPKTKEPAIELAKKVVSESMKDGVLMITGGMSGSVLRIQPPLTIPEEQADIVIDTVDKILNSI